MTTYYARTDVSYSGGDKLFSITFPYIDKTHIKVFVNEEQTTNFTFNTSSQILINDNITAGDVVSIRRITPIDNKMVVFSNTSILNKDNQNLAQDQVFNAVQEMRDENTTFKLDIEADFEDYKDEVDDTISNFENEVNAAIEDIEDIAETAEANSSTALSNAATALSNSQSAVSTSETALSTVNTALANSEEAVTKANAAVSTANEAKTTATTASTNASTAVSTANSAVATANGAVTTANSADSKADTAVSTANTALSNSQSAVSTANAAETKADSAVSTANSASSTASTASTNASNAVTTANSALSTAQSADGKVDSFGQDISSVLAAADKINALEEAVTTATGAATTASTAAQTATTAAQTATQAASTLVVDQTYDGTSTNAQSGAAIAGAGFLTGITSSDVTTALGYTPYNSTNPNGYITGINSTDVTNALGYTPYNSTNPNGYTSNVGTVTSVNGIQPINGNVALTIPTVTVDQTFDGTSTNAQSGVAIEGAGFLKNISDTPASNLQIGTSPFCMPGTQTDTVVIGNNIGIQGNCSNAILIGSSDGICHSGSSLSNSLTIHLNSQTYKLLDTSTGKIPDDRLSSNIERTSNKVTSISSSSTNTQYPSAKCVFDELADSVKQEPTDTLYCWYNADSTATKLYTNTITLTDGVSYPLFNFRGEPHTIYSYGVYNSSNNSILAGSIQKEYTRQQSDDIQFRSTLTDNNSNAFNIVQADGQWVHSQRVLGTSTAKNTYTVDISSYLPNDSYQYEVMINLRVYSNSSNAGNVYVYSDIWKKTPTTGNPVGQGGAGGSSRQIGNTFILPVGTARQIYYEIGSYAVSNVSLLAWGYRRIGTNS